VLAERSADDSVRMKLVRGQSILGMSGMLLPFVSEESAVSKERAGQWARRIPGRNEIRFADRTRLDDARLGDPAPVVDIT
jgi:hypothetical protein